jgi:hypothetical protein
MLNQITVTAERWWRKEGEMMAGFVSLTMAGFAVWFFAGIGATVWFVKQMTKDAKEVDTWVQK